MGDLLVCPFCRDLQTNDHATHCEHCGLKLVAMHKLPLSYEARLEQWEDEPPEHWLVDWTDWRRGRGVLAAVSIVGFALFFMPWIDMTSPEIVQLSGMNLAKKLWWMWACPIAWTMLTATALSRRTIAKMRGARVAAAFFCMIPVVTAVVVWLTPPKSQWLPVRLDFSWGLFGTLAVGIAALPFAITFGGRVPNETDNE